MRLRDGEEAPAEADMGLMRGAVETSNVNVVKALVDMIELARKFELQVKTMKEAEEMDNASASIMRMG